MNQPTEPKLAPPGAGLPLPELYIGRLLFALRRWTGNRDTTTAQFQQERENIRHLIRARDDEALRQRVLIARPPGLEDSSRYWSVWMTLDHLRIVHHEMARIIGALTKGVMPAGTASTAAVKPTSTVTAGVVADYEKSCDTLLELVAASGNLKTSLRFAHPWFGPLDAAGWHALSAGHLRIHRVQIQRILHGLPTRMPGG
ncbi:MAG: DinB family protein [Verrucomicrobiota bacterium]